MSWWWNGGMWKQSWPTITPGCVELCIQDFQAISTRCCVQSPPCSTHSEMTPQGRFHQHYCMYWVEDFGYCWRSHHIHHGIWLQVIQHCLAVGTAQREVTVWHSGEAQTKSVVCVLYVKLPDAATSLGLLSSGCVQNWFPKTVAPWWKKNKWWYRISGHVMISWWNFPTRDIRSGSTCSLQWSQPMSSIAMSKRH